MLLPADYFCRGDKELAAKILKEEIRVFFDLREDNMDPNNRRVQIYNEFASLLTFDDFRYDLFDSSSSVYFLVSNSIPRKHSHITWVDNARETRRQIFPNLKAYVLDRIPTIKHRCALPTIPTPGRLRTIINQRSAPSYLY